MPMGAIVRPHQSRGIDDIIVDFGLQRLQTRSVARI